YFCRHTGHISPFRIVEPYLQDNSFDVALPAADVTLGCEIRLGRFEENFPLCNRANRQPHSQRVSESDVMRFRFRQRRADPPVAEVEHRDQWRPPGQESALPPPALSRTALASRPRRPAVALQALPHRLGLRELGSCRLQRGLLIYHVARPRSLRRPLGVLRFGDFVPETGYGRRRCALLRLEFR